MAVAPEGMLQWWIEVAVDVQRRCGGDVRDLRLVSEEVVDLTLRIRRPADGDARAVDRQPEPRKLVSARYHLEHEPARSLFYLEGRPRKLSARQYEVLKYLGERQDHMVQSRHLLRQVWGAGYEGDEEALRSCIWRLRKALGPARELVQNRRGLGYGFVPEPPRARGEQSATLA